ncbi:MAG TPA: hypothetical protein VGG64_09220 [Pirellulales bacterium]|jgi:hypothetical protein
MRSKVQLIVGVLLGCLLSAAWTSLSHERATAAVESAPAAAHEHAESDNEELAAMYDADQADRRPMMQGDWPTDRWTIGRLLARDVLRQARLMTLYKGGALCTGNDYYHAAMILQHSQRPDGFLLAHEFCVVAIAKGNKRALWLAAATEDRFLMNIKRPQRFGTQYCTVADGPMALYRVEPGVTDALRKELHVPSLAEGKELEAKFQKLYPGKR